MLRLTLQFVSRLPVLQQGEITGHVFKEDLPLETEQKQTAFYHLLRSLKCGEKRKPRTMKWCQKNIFTRGFNREWKVGCVFFNQSSHFFLFLLIKHFITFKARCYRLTFRFLDNLNIHLGHRAFIKKTFLSWHFLLVWVAVVLQDALRFLSVC